ncbi:MAG: TIGR00730 family Rossman fold protein [Alphaproteobacteria bacterium]
MTDNSKLQSICVYCGSSDNGPGAHRDLARDLGQQMAANGVQLIYGGGRVGVMGAVADAVLVAGGTVTGVIPDFLMRREHGHHDVTNLEVVASMHERKARMAELSDAFIVLPGGLGTLEELFEIMTWRQLGLHDKPIVVINPDGHWDRLRGLIEDLVAAGYARPETTGLAHFVSDAAGALSALEAQLTGETHIETGRL